MKRGGPLRRTKKLDRAASQLKRTEIGRGSKRLRARPKKPLFDDREMAMLWHRRVCATAPVVKRRRVCPACLKPVTEKNPLEAHHVTTKEALKRFVAGLGLEAQEAAERLARLLWDARNGLPVCRDCHAAHTTGKRRLPVRLVTVKARQFAHEVGLDHLLDRYYRRD